MTYDEHVLILKAWHNVKALLDVQRLEHPWIGAMPELEIGPRRVDCGIEQDPITKPADVAGWLLPCLQLSATLYAERAVGSPPAWRIFQVNVDPDSPWKTRIIHAIEQLEAIIQQEVKKHVSPA